MSPSRESAGPRGPRRSHVSQRHHRAAPSAESPAPPPPVGTREDHALHARPLVRHIVALEAFGWRVVGLRPCGTGDEPALWSVTIKRYDEGVSITMIEADPDVALAELLRYARADAT